jgi:Kef-type K+ transport system membrane component KefB
MTTTIIITFCTILLVAYIFDLSAKLTRIPAVILLLALGWIGRQLTYIFQIQLPDFTPVLPVLGTVGLILIVLEGALELKLNQSKLSLVGKSFFGALIPMLCLAFLFAYLLRFFAPASFKDSLGNVIPLCVISSSIAISSVKNLASADKEFVIYESSFSDILGVLFFNFIILNNYVNGHSFATFGLQILAITFISLIAIVLLALLLSKIDHNIKFVPIILLVILIYTISHHYQLPALIFILLFGIFLGNLDELKRFRWFRKVKPDELDQEMKKFKELTIEAAFMLRSLFFLLFGYMIETKELLNVETLVWSLAIVVIIFIVRIIQLWISKLPLIPLLFIAPRGLVTILLFLSILPAKQIPFINKSLIIQVIVATSLIMMIGLLLTKKDAESEEKELQEPGESAT